MQLFDRLIARSLPFVPRFLVRWVANQYIAGETTGDALRTITELNGLGAAATLDLLGEEIKDTSLSRGIAKRYQDILTRISTAELGSGVSVKLSALSLRLDPALTRELLRSIVTTARSVNRFVRIDMEDATTTDETLAIYRELRAEGMTNVGVVLQACLKRTFDDAKALVSAGIADIRLVKGIYIEPEEISYRHPEAIRRNYVRILDMLVAEGARVASATHDDLLIYETEAIMSARGIEPGGLEFQMLLGVRERARDVLLGNGHAVRVYVPFGEQWYEYSVRRLRENPAVAGHVTRQLMGRMVGRKT